MANPCQKVGHTYWIFISLNFLKRGLEGFSKRWLSLSVFSLPGAGADIYNNNKSFVQEEPASRPKNESHQ